MKLTYEDGGVSGRNWDGRDRWVKWEWKASSKPSPCEIDPQHKILLDGSFADNSWVAIAASALRQVGLQASVLAPDGAAMTASQALRQGIGMLAHHKRLCLIFYAVTTAAALLIAAPLMTIVVQSLGDSAWAQQMAGNVDIAWLSEVVAANGGMPWIQAAMVLLGVGTVSAVVYVFLLGGALQVFSNGEDSSPDAVATSGAWSGSPWSRCCSMAGRSPSTKVWAA